VKAQIEVLVGLDPSAVNFGEVKVGTRVTRSLELVGKEADGVQLTIDAVSNEYLTATVRQDGERTLVDLTLEPARPGSVKARLSATTSHETVPKIHVRVNGKAMGNLRVAPHQVSIQNLDSEPKAGVVIITSEKAGFEVRSVSDPRELVDIVTSEQDGKWRIEVTAKESGEGTRSFRTHLEVQTNDDLEPTLEIPVVARSRSRRPGRGPIPGLDVSGSSRTRPKPQK